MEFKDPCLYALAGKSFSELLQDQGNAVSADAEGYAMRVLCALV